MPKRRMYPGEFREQLVELVRAGRTPESLAKEFEPSSQTNGNWAKQADLDGGRRRDGLTSAEREEMTRLRREMFVAAILHDPARLLPEMTVGLGLAVAWLVFTSV